MTIIIGALAMEMLGLMTLGGAAMSGVGARPFVLPGNAVWPIAFVIGVVLTYLLGRGLGVIDLGQIDSYRERNDAMQGMTRATRRVRPQIDVPAPVGPVVIQY
jgi:hypothetical protein